MQCQVNDERQKGQQSKCPKCLLVEPVPLGVEGVEPAGEELVASLPIGTRRARRSHSAGTAAFERKRIIYNFCEHSLVAAHLEEGTARTRLQSPESFA